MFIHKNSLFSLYFGDAQDGLMPAYYLNLPHKPLLEIEPFSELKGELSLKSLMFLHQTHSDQGLVLDERTMAIACPFKEDGDYLTTNMPHAGIGVMTADCLPIALYDTKNKAIAIIHAGWKGSVLGVAIKALERMQEVYGTHPESVSVFFGPSALVCCYEVSRGFESHLEGFSWINKQQVFIERDDKLFFNVPLFNQLQLEAAGIKREFINSEYNVCTLCDSSFYSHRRDGQNAGRQMTVVCLNKV